MKILLDVELRSLPQLGTILGRKAVEVGGARGALLASSFSLPKFVHFFSWPSGTILRPSYSLSLFHVHICSTGTHIHFSEISGYPQYSTTLLCFTARGASQTTKLLLHDSGRGQTPFMCAVHSQGTPQLLFC